MKTTIKILTISFFAITLFTMCNYLTGNENVIENQSSLNLKNYYYPIDNLRKTKVYHYKPDNLEEAHLFWELISKIENGKTFLYTNSYSIDNIGNVKFIETIKEEITDLGSIVKEYTEYQYEPSGKNYAVKAKIGNDYVFKWVFKKNEPIIWDFVNQSKVYQGYNVKTSKTRNWLDITETINFNNQKLKAVLFSDIFEVNFSNEKRNDNQTFQFSQISYYAENIGMYKYTRKFSDGGQITYTLEKILTIEEWEEKKKKE